MHYFIVAEWEGLHSCNTQAGSGEYPKEACSKDASVPQGYATSTESTRPFADTVPGVLTTVPPAGTPSTQFIPTTILKTFQLFTYPGLTRLHEN